MAEWHEIETAPLDRPVQLCVLDEQGVHALNFPCRAAEGGWVNAVTTSHIDFRPTHWRDWRRGERVAALEADARIRVNRMLIGAELATLYDEFLSQPIPPALATLLDELTETELRDVAQQRAKSP